MHLMAASIGLLLALVPLASSQGLPVQYGLLPLGDLTTVDQDGPYFVPKAQSFEVCIETRMNSAYKTAWLSPRAKVAGQHCNAAASW